MKANRSIDTDVLAADFARLLAADHFQRYDWLLYEIDRPFIWTLSLAAFGRISSFGRQAKTDPNRPIHQ
jgi:hypothetical protein